MLYVLGLINNLISILQLQDKGIIIRFISISNRLLIERQRSVIRVADRLGKSYTLNGVIAQGLTGDTSLKAAIATNL